MVSIESWRPCTSRAVKSQRHDTHTTPRTVSCTRSPDRPVPSPPWPCRTRARATSLRPARTSPAQLAASSSMHSHEHTHVMGGRSSMTVHAHRSVPHSRGPSVRTFHEWAPPSRAWPHAQQLHITRWLSAPHSIGRHAQLTDEQHQQSSRHEGTNNQRDYSGKKARLRRSHLSWRMSAQPVCHLTWRTATARPPQGLSVRVDASHGRANYWKWGGSPPSILTPPKTTRDQEEANSPLLLP